MLLWEGHINGVLLVSLFVSPYAIKSSEKADIHIQEIVNAYKSVGFTPSEALAKQQRISTYMENVYRSGLKLPERYMIGRIVLKTMNKKTRNVLTAQKRILDVFEDQGYFPFSKT